MESALKKGVRLLAVLVYAYVMGFGAWKGFTAPYKNWDILGYTGSVIAWSEKDADAIYASTKAAIKEDVSNALYRDLFSGPLSNQPKAFVAQLPFYQVKPLYNGLIWLLHQTGLGLPAGSWVISATCFALLSVLLFFWRPRYMAKEFWLLLILLLTCCWQYPMSSLACWSTPDCIATLLLNAALFSWLMHRSFRLFCLFSYLAMFARPDALLLFGVFSAYFCFVPSPPQRMPIKGVIGLAGASFITYLTISHLAGNYGLERWFIYAFINRMPYPAEAKEHLTWTSYWNTQIPSAKLFLGLGRTLCLSGFSLFACFCYYLRPAEGNRLWLHLLLLIWLCIALRFLMFPAWGDDRYYFVYYLPILFAGGELIAPCLTVLRRVIKEYPDIPQNT